MSLQGTLETISLPDVLSLLAATKKTGELRITGGRGEGRLWLDTGRVIAADVARATTTVDAVFELLRLTTGAFTFGVGAPGGVAGEPVVVDVLLAEAQRRLSAWQAIEAVVPSMACTVRLMPELAHDAVTVSRQQWTELVAVAGGGDVNGVMKTLGTGEFDTCRTVKELVDSGLIQVGGPPAKPARGPDQDRSGQPTMASLQETARTERGPGQTTGPTRRPAPTVGRAPASTHAAAPPAGSTSAGSSGPSAPEPARSPVLPPAAPVAAANGGRGAAARRGPERAETAELVQQLGALGREQRKAGPTGADAAESAAEAQHDHASTNARAVHDDETSGNGDEPINRGMLLKFLSSVRP